MGGHGAWVALPTVIKLVLCKPGSCQLACSPARRVALQAPDCIYLLPAMQIAGTHCTACYLKEIFHFYGDEAGWQTTLHLVAAQPLEALQPLLSAVLPPSVTLEALELERVSFSAAAVQGCTRLTTLERMNLIRCQFDAAAAAALFSNSPQLAALQLNTDALFFSEDEAGGSPADQLQLLPELQWLRVSAGLTGVPPQLVELTNLQSLVS